MRYVCAGKEIALEIVWKIFLPKSNRESIIRGYKVLLDSDLATLYGVETKNLNKAVQRNIERFPSDFMFQLTNQEVTNLRFQIGTSSLKEWGGRRYLPIAFTEQGVAMLSSVLKSKNAISVNIEIMRTFVQLRQILSENKELAKKFEELEKKYDSQFKVVFDAIKLLIEQQPSVSPKRRKIGFEW